MTSTGAWLRQTNSDMLAASCLSARDSEDLYCRICAKCQQVLEKSLKAIATELTDRGKVTLTIGFIHNIDGLIAPILRTPHFKSVRNSVPEYISSTLRNNLLNIKILMSLAPMNLQTATVFREIRYILFTMSAVF